MKGSIPYYGATGIMDYVNRPIFSGNFVLLAEDGSVMDDNGNPILQEYLAMFGSIIIHMFYSP